MVAQERINVRETVGRKNNCKLNFFSMYFVRNNEEIHLSFKNIEKYRTQALKLASAIFYQFFIFSPNDSSLKTMKNVFYFI